MSAIRGRDTEPEVAVRSYLHRQGFRFRLHGPGLPGRPDIVLPKYAAVVLVHGCYWHQHRGCKYAYKPKSNRAFWNGKLAGNVVRDGANEKRLAELGWRVFTVWECEINHPRVLETLSRRIREARRGPRR